ncbi:B3/B4 domain-containing protein [Labrys monachus]|uniref:DNA/RNA-binding domain of Phe-tRNA-synthetase-like protein n=1 Tax=Labrys monachus TaxID=217067 RepID=A0ABU0FL75_9HYPH|nr:phenylalanine--tRNA ligase beta subunit-related protein [Labrys monachus]MDQ0395271.1 DNA/RNA-binding domain of Phe-tRNA-synthetase-like protein [Labrys monachus]
MELSIAELTQRFPDFRVAVLVAERLSIGQDRSEELDGAIHAMEAASRARHAGIELSAIPGVAAWRSAYKGFGIKKTSYRSSVERLLKRVIAGDGLPRINSFVDIYNAVSLAHGFCVGADDLDRIAPPVAFRFSRPGDTFLDMGAEAGEDPNDPPKDGEVVLADTRHVLCRRWNWRQDMRSAITTETRRALITVQANGWGDLEAAVGELAGLLAHQCGADVRIGYADAQTPRIAIG